MKVLAFQSLFEEGRHRILDFTEEEGEPKLVFPRTANCVAISLFQSRPWIIATLVAHAAMDLMTVPLSGVFHQPGLLAKGHRLLR